MACGDEIPVTVEYRRIWFPVGTLVDPVKYCVDADTDCCGSGSGESPSTNPPCCTGEYTTDLIAEFVGPFGADCASQTRTVSLVWNSEILAWEGTSDESAEGDYLAASVWCDGFGYYGSVEVYRGGLLLTSFELAPTASGDGTTLVESVDVSGLSCDPDTVTVEIEHPCPGGGGGGGVTVDCCTEAIPTTLTVTVTSKTGDCTCLPDSFVMAWNGSAWVSSETICSVAGAFRLQCNSGGGSWGWTASPIAGPGACVWVDSETSWACSPFEIVFAGVSISGCCTGTATFTVTA